MSNSWGVQPNNLANAFNPFLQPVKITLEQSLLRWEQAKKELEKAKESEAEARRLAFELGFGKDAKEGTNTLELNNGYALKGVKKLNYKLVKPASYVGDIVDAVDDCADKFTKISNEGSFIAERLFKYSVDISVSEYKKLLEEAAYSEPKKAMLAEVNKILEIKEAMPTLEIKEPKAKK